MALLWYLFYEVFMSFIWITSVTMLMPSAMKVIPVANVMITSFHLAIGLKVLF